ncbi:EVE domain-containing protein [Rufibacter glacialis]|uniref:EVE domain-containing protein n=1 Tax=Rufibacter glacialis TaxID=1259555 RepID=A0A5M8QTB3_9BACT|nr:EVE domain-containing protein [Rufibacter glacialis]KAA6437442.1 EVE domain-containing protein [Rufibacter glacialis]GGK59269.1 ubiquinol-cytochrome c reductase [Rufibacter glacialis]
MNYWLVKTEPEKYAWSDLQRDKQTTWDGVRNYQARNNLQKMQVNDLVLYYHSVSEKSIVGVARVSREAFQDPTTQETQWQAVTLVPEQALAKPVTLDQIKKEERLQNIALLRQSRLSVMPLTPEEFDILLAMGQGG